MAAIVQAIEEEQNERASAIVLGAMVEASLMSALTWGMSIDDPDLHDRIFEGDGPLSDFSGKILMASALRLIGPIARLDLDIIRHVRNAFAHSLINVSFATPEIMETCDRLKKPPEIETFRPLFRFDTPRHKYAYTCEWLYSQFIRGVFILMTTKDRSDPSKRLYAACPQMIALP
jgi:hypothetical protein